MTKTQQWLSNKYILYKMLTSLWFVSAIWLYFYRIFITDQQVGMLDGLAFTIGLIAEVPSGQLADRFGRHRLVRLGQILSGLGLLIQSTGSSFLPFVCGQAIMMIGVAFVSGADDALFFQNMNFEKDSPRWRKLLTRASQFALVATIFATISGGWLYSINPRLPWMLNGLAFIVAALIVWPIVDRRPRKARLKLFAEIKEYLVDIRHGFVAFWQPKLWLYVPFIIAVQGLFYTTGYGLLRLILLGRFGFSPLEGSWVIASSSLLTVGLLYLMHKHAERLSEKRVLLVIGLSAAMSLLFSLTNIGKLGFIIILVLYAGEHVLHPFMSEVINKHADEDQRATLLSVASFLRTLPYVILAPIIGYLNTNGQIEYFLIIWALLIIGAVLLYLANKRKDAKIEFVE